MSQYGVGGYGQGGYGWEVASGSGNTIATVTGHVIAAGYAPAISQVGLQLDQATINAIAAAVWVDSTAISAHAKLDAILVRITC